MSNPTSKASSVTPALRQQPVKLYNTSKNRRGNPIVFPHQMLRESANHPVRLVPIRLDLEMDGYKIRDSFAWNLNETLITPEQFAQLLIEDIYETPPAAAVNLIGQIAQSIRSQNAVHDDEDAIVSTDQSASAEDDPGWRTLIRLDLQVGPIHLVDQFEWPMLPSTSEFGSDPEVGAQQPTPESFAKTLCADMGIGSEFVSIIAHSIREQLCYARLNFDEAPKVQGVEEPPLRKEIADEDWQPVVEHLSEEEIERRFKEQERTARRLRRSQRISTTNTIVMTRGYGEDGDSDDESGGRRRSRAASAMARNSSGIRHNPMMGNNRSMTPYASFSALPLQYQSGMFNPSSLAYGRHLQAQQQAKAIPYRNYKPSPEEEALILKKLEETINLRNLSPQKSPPKRHRGFGASANRFNEDGTIAVGEFREKWRCSWCLLSGKFTPTLRKGPMGSKTLCNACGIWYGKHGSLPKDRYHEHADSEK